jgi:hypothetical protein
MPNALPVRRLQFVQLQTPCIEGSASTVMEACPQAQVAVIWRLSKLVVVN